MNAEQLKKTYVSMKAWLTKHKRDAGLDDEMLTHHLNNLYFTYCGLRPACLIRLGSHADDFAEKFGLVFKEGPYFDSEGTEIPYFVNKKEMKRLEPLFKRLEETYPLMKPDSDGFLAEPKKLSEERVAIIGTILGFDTKCIGATRVQKDRIGIFFYTHPNTKSTELTEVFAYGCDINTPNLMDYPIQLMKESKKYLEPIGLKLAFQVLDWS